jgi:hypothetical protein
MSLELSAEELGVLRLLVSKAFRDAQKQHGVSFLDCYMYVQGWKECPSLDDGSTFGPVTNSWEPDIYLGLPLAVWAGLQTSLLEAVGSKRKNEGFNALAEVSRPFRTLAEKLGLNEQGDIKQ